MNELELQKGKYTLKTLAEWFNISYSTLRNKKEKYLKLLEEYAKFDILPSGKIDIISVKIPVYVKPDSAFQKIKAKVPEYWDESGLDKKNLVTRKLYSKEELSVKYNTAYSYVCKASNELWGKPNSLMGGERGSCRWILCVRDLSTNTLRQFTDEENQTREQFRQ